MKLVSMESYIVATPSPHIGGMYWIFVHITTDCGIRGVGEIYSATFHPDGMKPLISDVFERYLLNQDPHHIEKFWRLAYSSGFTQRPDLTMMGIVSGFEMACWDIIGKAANKPVYELIGGKVHEKLRSYTYLYPKNSQGEYDYNDPDLAAECAAEYAKQGFTALKFDPAGPYSAFSGHNISLEIMDRCELFCKKVREAVGSKCDILIGTHGQMTPSSAIRLAKRLEKYDPMWFEEPVPPGQEEAMAEVARKTTIPISAGERLTTKYEFYRLLNTGAARILQMNLGRVGGILEAKKIAAIAEVFYAQIAPHVYNGPIGAAASFQLAMASPNFLIQESIMTWGGFYAEILQTPINSEDGYIIPSGLPGLGVELNMDVVKMNSPYIGDKLHLQMSPIPFDMKDHSPAKG